MQVKPHQLPAIQTKTTIRWDVDDTTIHLDRATGRYTGETLMFDYDTNDWDVTPIPDDEAAEFARQQMLISTD